MSITTTEEVLLQEGEREKVWQTPVPLRRVQAVPEVPLGLLPEWLGQWAAAVAESVQVPVDLPTLLGLTVAAAGVARKVRVHVRSDWAEPTNLYSAVLVRTGERKSKVFALATAPVRSLAVKLHHKATDQALSIRFSQGIMAGKLKKLVKNLTDCSEEAEADVLLDQAKSLMRSLEATPPPASPVLVADDQTLDSLGQLLIEQGGRILVVSPEGRPLESFKGRVTGRTTIDLYLKGYCGDPMEVGGGRKRKRIDKPAVSMALAIPPDGIRGAGMDMTLARRSFLARILYACPTSRVGQRQVGTARIPKEIAAGYEAAITELWGIDYAKQNKYGKDIPHLMRFSPEGAAVMEEFERWLEPQLGIDGTLAPLAGWAKKLAGVCARLAGVLHLGGSISHLGSEIPVATVEAALRLGREYFVPHAWAAFGLMDQDPRISLSVRILGWARKEQRRCFTRRDCHVRFQGEIESVEDLVSPLKLLEEHGWLREVVGPERVGRGRRASQVFEVHPEIEHLDYGARRDQWDRLAMEG